MPDLTLDLGAALAYSLVPPYMVEHCVAGWSEEDEHDTIGGFVLKLIGPHWAYVTFCRRKKQDYSSSSTEYFTTEPTHLYTRGIKWEFNKGKLNAGLQTTKQEANYPTGRVAVNAGPGEVVRVPF